MGLSHEHVGPKILAKIKIYMLTRAELLCALCYEIPCIFLVLATPQLGTYQQPYTHTWRMHAYDTVVDIKPNLALDRTHRKYFSFLKNGEKIVL